MEYPKISFNEILGKYIIRTSDGKSITIENGWEARKLQEDLFRLHDEIKRLKEGNFTEEEFQNLCHNFSPDDKCRFQEGCREYQKKLFGE